MSLEDAPEKERENEAQDMDDVLTVADDLDNFDMAMAEDSEDFGEIFEQSLREHSAGEIVKGVIVKVNKDDVVVDVGMKSEGIIPLSEFAEDGEDKNVFVGQEIDVYIVKRENSEGLPILSRQQAKRAKAKKSVKKAFEAEKPVKVKVVEVLKGGLRVSADGLTGFMPFSHTGIRSKRKEDAEELVGQEIDALVIEMRGKRDVIFSRRAWLDAERSRLKTTTLDNLTPGDKVTGIVKNLTQFGAFVDIGGIDGLLHVNDMAWSHVAKPSEVVQVGDEIEIMILAVEGEKISLGLKQLTPDPWDSIGDKYPANKHVKGKVTSLAKYGAFVELEAGVEGLIHISEMSWTKRLKHPSEMFKEGDHVECVVLRVDEEKRRISLGYKQLTEDPWTVAQLKYPQGSITEGEVIGMTDFGAFIRLDEGVDGMIHVSDMSWTTKIKHPSDLLKKGERIQCTVLEIDPENQRISLGLKQVEGNPWDNAARKYKVGEHVDVRVTKLTDFGVFAEIEEGIEGLAHISELSNHKIGHPSEILSEGDVVTMKIIKFDPHGQKVGLSLKGFHRDEEQAEIQQYLTTDEEQGGLATLGEILDSATRNK